MARQDAKMGVRYHHATPPKRKLEYLLNETYQKIDELKELLRKEAALTGSHGNDVAVGRMFSRQDYLITLCAEACSEYERNHGPQPGPSGLQGTRTLYVKPPVATGSTDHSQSSRSDKDPGRSDGSWYGSLDRSLAKKKKHQVLDKRRRHTKTIGSMAGLDVLKKSGVELKPDEQYEIGLPAAPRVTSTRSSIFPMTQHQYYTALMESRLTKKLAYPLDLRHPHYYPPPHSSSGYSRHPHWGGYPGDSLDENKNKKQETTMSHQASLPVLKPPQTPNLVPLPCRSLGNEGAQFRQSGKSSSKKWYETNLDEAPPTPTTLNPSPSPSMMSSARGSSRGSVASGLDTVDAGIARMAISSPANDSVEFTSKSSESSESWSAPGNEVTKPFEMSDYYKYSTKFRSRNSPVSEESVILSPIEPRVPMGPPSSASTTIIHPRQGSHSRLPSFDSQEFLHDTNGNPSVGPKLPPKQRRPQNKSFASSGIIFEGGSASNGDPATDVWITNEPTFV